MPVVTAPSGADVRVGGTLVMTLLGIGAMASPRFAPAGLLVVCGGRRVAIDGGPGAEPGGRLDAWLVTDDRSELRAALRRLAAQRGLEPVVGAWRSDTVGIEPHPVVHTSHPTFGYLVESAAGRVAWAPEFWTFPEWAAGVDLMFAEAARWDRPIRGRRRRPRAGQPGRRRRAACRGSAAGAGPHRPADDPRRRRRGAATLR
jgi:hypothetical protein